MMQKMLIPEKHNTSMKLDKRQTLFNYTRKIEAQIFRKNFFHKILKLVKEKRFISSSDCFYFGIF